jgi:hypothetical protein
MLIYLLSNKESRIYNITTYLSMFLSAMIMRIIVKKGKVLAPRTLLIGGMEH